MGSRHPAARRAFDAISGGAQAGGAEANSLGQRVLTANVMSRLGNIDNSNSSSPLKLALNENNKKTDIPEVASLMSADSREALNPSGSSFKEGFWLKGYGGSGHFDGESDNSNPSYTVSGVLVGLDSKINHHVTLGILAGYAEPKFDDDGLATHTKTKSTQLAVYGRIHKDAWHLDGLLGYTWNRMDSKRTLSIGGLERTATWVFLTKTAKCQLASFPPPLNFSSQSTTAERSMALAASRKSYCP